MPRDVYSYSDGRNVFSIVEWYSGFGTFLFVFQNDKELVSYGGVGDYKFYIKHFGKEYKGRVVKGEKTSVKKRGSEFEIEVKGDFSLVDLLRFELRFDYRHFGKRLTPYIEFRKPDWRCVILPELDKVYKGREVEAWRSKPWGLQVENYSSDNYRVYLLMLDGREYLVYEGKTKSDFAYRYSPEFFKVGNVMVVELSRVDQYFKKYFVKSPDFSYLFVEFYYKGNEKFARISFDLENWVEVKAERIVLKEGEGLRLVGSINRERWLCERTKKEIIEVLERLRAYFLEESEPESSPSLGV